MQRYFMLGQYNHIAQEEQALPEPHARGDWVRYEDAQAEIDRLRAALTEALPALRMAYKGGHELTENYYIAYKTACELTDPPNDKAMGRREAAS